MRLSGKTALITGGTSGIGRAIAEAFAREGARVALTGRDDARGQATVEAISAMGGQATFIRADLGSLSEVRWLARQATATLGEVDILVNNAGVFTFAPTEALDEVAYDAMMDTNVKAPFFLTAALAPLMAQRGKGKIINITTMVAYFGMSAASAYGASKSALDLLGKAWAAEYGPLGVNVNTISPGPIRTEGTAGMGENLDQLASMAPAGRPGRPEEIAAAAVYLASDESDFVHGATLAVDGGRVAA
jgi:NAD(P)-dependent dehydrogenase (short-subunit alcohol dehydrogenase family)